MGDDHDNRPENCEPDGIFRVCLVSASWYGRKPVTFRWRCFSFFFFFFNNIELAAKLIYYFFFFLLMAFRQNWKTLSRLLFLFHNMGNKMLISFLLGWQALQFKQGLKLHQHKGSYVLILCYQNCVLTALLEAKTSQAGFTPWHLLSTNKSDFMPPEQCHSLALHQFVSLFCFLSCVTQSICDST